MSLQALSHFVANTRFSDIPSDVVERAKWVMRDTVAVIIAGLVEPENQRLADYAANHQINLHNHFGNVTIFGQGTKVRPEWAVLVHGTAGTALELDEGHAFAKGHAAIHAVPTALALAEANDVSAKELLTAFIVGYEVTARAGVATKLRPAVHPFGAWGVLGAAAIGAYFNRLDGDGVAGVLELAASYAINPSFESAFQGANVRNTYAGVVNRLGLLAVELYQLGFRGEKGGLETTFGNILGESFDATALTDGLRERYEIMRGYFKPYSACRYTHGAVEASLTLKEQIKGRLDDIQSISVATYNIAATLKDSAPKTPLAGRFSLPYVVAICLILGHANRDAFTEDKLQDSSIQSLANLVTVSEDKTFTEMTPAKRPSRISIHLKDGTTLTETVYGSKGDPDQPMSDEELKAKFMNLVEPSLGSEKSQTLWQAFDTLEDAQHISEITKHLEKRFVWHNAGIRNRTLRWS